MKVTVKPTENINTLRQNLEKRTQDIEFKEDKLIVEVKNPSKLGKVPGIKSYIVEGEEKQGVKGSPVKTPVYARINSMQEAVKALIATIEGYDLRILNSDREWDIRHLRRYNPDIKHLKSNSPLEVLNINKTISDIGGLEKIEIEIPEKKEDIKQVYREMLT